MAKRNTKKLITLCFLLFAPNWNEVASAQSTPELEFVTSTRLQIVLRWNAEDLDTAAGYQLQRSTSPSFSSPVTMSISSSNYVFSDTGLDLSNPRRLASTSLVLGVTYYYRIRAQYPPGPSDWSNTVSGQVQLATRGVEGDLFADIVIGQKDFSQNSLGETRADDLGMCGGILIDTSSDPQRLFLADLANNRILGFKDIDALDATPEFVIGQEDFNSSAANHDSTMSIYPDYTNPTADTLALMKLEHIPVIEAMLMLQMALDDSGSLYVPDPNNNRVLRYDDPFTNDTTADEVWGQPDFLSRTPNNGGVSAHSLSLKRGHTAAGVALDASGSLWVTDVANCRVLRFPKDDGTGTISKTADLVIGQQNFTTVVDEWFPNALCFFDGSLYVADNNTDSANPVKYRIAVYAPPFVNGMSPTRILASYPEVDQPAWFTPDPFDRGIWVRNVSQKWNADFNLMNVQEGSIIESVHGTGSRGLSVDNQGRLFVHLLWDGLYRYDLPYDDNNRTFLMSDEIVLSGRDFWEVKGVVEYGDQVILVDGERVLIYDSPESVTNYALADDIWGQETFTSDVRNFMSTHAFPNIDGKNRLWLFGLFESFGWRVGFAAFDYPLTHDSTPVKQLGYQYSLVDGGQITLARPAGWYDFAPSASGDELWIPDSPNSRVVRVNNIDGENDPKRGAYVDVILGQHDSISVQPNQGGDIAADSFNKPNYAKLDAEGNLYISDNSGEGGTNQRLMVFDHSLFPDDMSEVLYAVPATGVFGTKGCLDCRGCLDDTCGPLQCAFGPKGELVLGLEAYNGHGQRFPLVFMEPLENPDPQFILGDAYGSATYSFINSQGDVYIADSAWSRVLVYKKPFLRLYPEQATSGVSAGWMLY